MLSTTPVVCVLRPRLVERSGFGHELEQARSVADVRYPLASAGQGAVPEGQSGCGAHGVHRVPVEARRGSPLVPRQVKSSGAVLLPCGTGSGSLGHDATCGD